jgi:hypothetical protein
MGRSVSGIIATFLLAAALATGAGRARADDDRPTSGDLSILSGRTFGSGENALAAGIGWPGIWAGAFFAPTPRFNFGIRGTVLYGNPMMGFDGGIGGEVSVPLRFHLFGRGQLDVALWIEPAFFTGEGTLAGDRGIGADEQGFGGRIEIGGLAGAQVTQAVTIVFGIHGAPGYVTVPDVADGSHFVATTSATLGVEALPARDTMLFAVAKAGYGFAPDRLFDGHEVIALAFGLAYLL